MHIERHTEQDIQQLRTELLAAAREVQPSPGFADAVTRSARRRTFRRRSAVAGAFALTAMVGGAAVVLAPQLGPPGAPMEVNADERLLQPTRGDLAADRDFLARAKRAWEDGVPKSHNFSRGIFDDRRGDPHVYWAGNTPAGPAAVILQRAFLHEHDNLSPADSNEWQTLVGLVGIDPADSQLRLMCDAYQPDGFPVPGAFLFGPGDRTVLVMDRGTPLFVSGGPLVDANGKSNRAWQPLTVRDGVALSQLPEGTVASDVGILTREPRPQERDWNDLLTPVIASEYLAFAKSGPHDGASAQPLDKRLPWTAEDARAMRVGDERPVPEDIESEFMTALDEGGFLDPLTNRGRYSTWFVIAGLADGRTALIGESQEEDRPSRLFAVLEGPGGDVRAVLPGGEVDPAAILPVKIRMPDGQGWVVAAYGSTLRYRTGPDGAWIGVGQNAALLPDAATQVEVIPGQSSPTVVDLPR